MEKNDYDFILGNISNRVNSNKTKQLSNEIKLDEHVSSYKKVINKITKEVSQEPAKDNISLWSTCYFDDNFS